MRRRALVALTAFLLPFGPAPPAHALLCVPLLGCTCSVTVTDMAFGNVEPLLGATATADVQVHCTGVVDALPLVDAKIGAGAYGPIADRQMQSAAGDHLHYNIYASPVSPTILGEGAGGFPALSISGGLLVLGSWTATEYLYGRLPADPAARAGQYTDTIVVRIDW